MSAAMSGVGTRGGLAASRGNSVGRARGFLCVAFCAREAVQAKPTPLVSPRGCTLPSSVSI